ncbi:MAG TPA: nucleotidyltransferase domain-containing protein [Candidatus Obscuribacterales bacterium]
MRCPADFQVFVFGSRARGNADKQSDLDLLVSTTSTEIDSLKEVTLDVACELTINHGILISPLIAGPAFRERFREYSFITNIEAEAVAI